MAADDDPWFRLLGPFEVRLGNTLITPTAVKQRLLLAVLACHANTVVTTDQLVNELWDTEPPSTARALVAGYVAKLRQRLSEPAGHTLVTRGSGYQLRSRPDHIDAAEFERFCEQGLAAHRQRAYDDAADGLSRALALWTAPVLVDLPAAPSVQATRTRLDARRMAAAQAWADAQLARGHHRELIADLEPLVVAYPLQEDLRHHLMVAFYRSGRQADALASYRDLRTQLVEELGVEPGPELQQLHQRLLTGDPSVRAPAPAPRTAEPAPLPASPECAVSPVRAGPPAPRQLPPDTTTFTARECELARLREQLEPALAGQAAAVAAVYGPAGVGKSAMVVRLAHQLADRFGDGLLYADLHGASPTLRPVPPHAVLVRFLRDLGVADTDISAELDEATATYRSVLAGRRVLVVADNVVNAAQVRPLLPASPSCAALVTSRTALATLEGARHLQLDVLAPEDAVELVSRVGGPERVAVDPLAAESVARACDYLPLALRVAGAKLAARPTWTVRALADRLADEQRRLDELALADVGVRSSFQVSYRELQAGTDPVEQWAARLFGLLSLVNVPESAAPVAAALAGMSAREAEAALERLVDAQLVDSPASGRYRLHDLLRLYARETVVAGTAEADRRAAVARALDYYLASARSAGRTLFPAEPRTAGSDGHEFADRAQALRWLETERLNLLAAARQAAADESSAGVAVRLGAALFRFLDLRGHWHLLCAFADLALGAARLIDDLPGQAQAYNDLGAARVRLRRLEPGLAALQESLRIRRSLDDQPGQAATLNNLGNAYRGLHRLTDAAECFRASLTIRRTIGDRHGEVRALDNLANIHQERGEHERSVACRLESLTIARELGDQQLVGVVLVNLARVRLAADDPAGALTPAQQSVAICHESGNRYGEAIAWWALGDAAVALGRRRQARESWQAAASILEQLDSPGLHELRELLGRVDPQPPDGLR